MTDFDYMNPEPDYVARTPEEAGATDTQRVAASELRAIVERVERVDEEARAAAEARKEILSEAKGRGYDPKIVKRIVSERKRDREDVEQEEAVLALYREALEGRS